MRRYHVTQDATTTAGGKILAATSLLTISGQRVAQEDDAVFCPACKSEGRIVCVGPRVPELAPKPVALADDLCRCRCPILPKLVAVQTLRCQVIGSGEGGATAPLASAASTSPVHDEAFRAIDPRSGLPLAGLPYKIVHASGAEMQGRTDDQGFTERVFTSFPEQLSLYWLDEEPPEEYDPDGWEEDPC